MAADMATRGSDTTPPTGRLAAFLSAPLFITVVAMLAGYLIPRIVSRAEDHRKARELQTALVQDMAQSVAGVIPTGQLLAIAAIHKEAANGNIVFDQALLEWTTDRASIEAQLNAYFARASVGGQELPAAWRAYARAVENLYYVSTTELPRRCERATALAS